MSNSYPLARSPKPRIVSGVQDRVFALTSPQMEVVKTLFALIDGYGLRFAAEPTASTTVMIARVEAIADQRLDRRTAP